MEQSEVSDKWSSFQANLKQEVGNEAYEAWCGGLKFVSQEVRGDKTVITLSVPTSFLCTWLKGNHLRQITTSWPKCSEDLEVKIEIVVRVPKPHIEPQAKKIPPPIENHCQSDEGKKGGQKKLVAVPKVLPIEAPKPNQTRDLNWKMITKVVAKHFGVSSSEVTGPGRTREFVRPRRVAFWLIRNHLGTSMPKIGKRFDRDHTTVLYNLRQAEAMLANADEELEEQMRAIEAELGLSKTEQKNDYEPPI